VAQAVVRVQAVVVQVVVQVVVVPSEIRAPEPVVAATAATFAAARPRPAPPLSSRQTARPRPPPPRCRRDRLWLLPVLRRFRPHPVQQVPVLVLVLVLVLDCRPSADLHSEHAATARPVAVIPRSTAPLPLPLPPVVLTLPVLEVWVLAWTGRGQVVVERRTHARPRSCLTPCRRWFQARRCVAGIILFFSFFFLFWLGFFFKLCLWLLGFWLSPCCSLHVLDHVLVG